MRTPPSPAVPSPWRLPLFALLVLCAAAGTGRVASAQGVGKLIGRQAPTHEVEREPVLNASVDSFAAAATARLALGDAHGVRDGVADLDESRRRALRDEAVAGFRRAADRRLDELLADGVLLAGEVGDALPEVRSEHLERLDQIVAAALAGVEPPPARDDFASEDAHDRAMLKYVCFERNRWVDWLRLLGGMVAGFGLALGVLRVSKWGLGEQGGGRAKRLARAVVGNLHGPLYLIFAAGGLGVGLRAVWLPPDLYEPAWTVILVLIFVGAFWVSWRLSETATRRVGDWATPSGESPGEQVLEIVRKLLRLGLILLFVVLGVEIVFGTELTAVLAGLGVLGLAVTLAAQDTLKDLFAALTIHVNRPFALGDLVRYEGYFGTIEEIGFRMTRIRTLDGHLVTVPNARMVTQAIENVDARPHIRRRFRLDLPYDTPIERVRRAVEVVREVIEGQGDLDEDRGVHVAFDEFGPHSLRLLVQYYYAEGDYWKAKEQATEVDLALVERFRDEGIDFAFPTQTLHLIRDGEPAPDEGCAPDEDAEEDAT